MSKVDELIKSKPVAGEKHELELWRTRLLLQISRSTVRHVDNYEKIFGEIAAILAAALEVKRVSIMIKERNSLIIAGAVGIPEDIMSKVRVIVGEGVAGRVAQTGEALFIRNTAQKNDIAGKGASKGADSYKTQCFISHPIKEGNEVLGVINITDPCAKEELSEDDYEFFKDIADITAVVIQKALQFDSFRGRAEKDALTGLLNRHQMKLVLERESERAQRYGFPICMIMFDIDNFKSVNDEYGHQKGDEVLVQFAEILTGATRKVDYIIRYGGEEFLSILPHTPKENADKYAGRIVERTFLNLAEKCGLERNITVSAGVATFPMDGDSLQVVLEKADMALLKAKSEGKNRIVIHQGIK